MTLGSASPLVLPAHQLPDPLGGLRPHQLHLLQLLRRGGEDPLHGPEVAEEVLRHCISDPWDGGDQVLLLLFEGPVGLLAVGLGGAAPGLLLPPGDGGDHRDGLILVGRRDDGDAEVDGYGGESPRMALGWTCLV